MTPEDASAVRADLETVQAGIHSVGQLIEAVGDANRPPMSWADPENE
jgi:hypothetical protein